MPTLTPSTTRFTIGLDLTPVCHFNLTYDRLAWTCCCYSDTIHCEWEAWEWTWHQGKGKKGENGKGKCKERKGKCKEGKGDELMST